MATVSDATIVERWSNLQAAGGAALGSVDPILEGSTLKDAADHSDALSLVLPRETAATISIGEVLRVTESSGRVTEWDVRLIRVSPFGATATVTADPWWHRLARLPGVSNTPSDVGLGRLSGALTITDWIDDELLPYLSDQGITWITRGTVEPTTVVGLDLLAPTPIAVVRTLAETVQGTAAWRFTRTSGTSYALDFYTTLPSVTHYPMIGEDVLALTEETDAQDILTQITPLSREGLTLADARWNITTGISSVTRTLRDPVTLATPFTASDQAIGWYLVGYDYTSNLPRTVGPITASTAAGVVTFGSDPTASIGSMIYARFALDADGTPVTSLENPSGIALYQRRASVIRAVDQSAVGQLIPDPLVQAASGGWTRQGSPTEGTYIPAAEFGVTRTGAANGLRSAGTGTGTPFTTDGWPASTKFYIGDPLVVAGMTLYVDADATADGAGAVSLTLSSVNGSTIADNDVITLTRPSMIPAGYSTAYGARLTYSHGGTYSNTLPHFDSQYDLMPPPAGTRSITGWADFALSAGSWTDGGTAPRVAIGYGSAATGGTITFASESGDAITVATGDVRVVRVPITVAVPLDPLFFGMRVTGGSSSDYSLWCVLLRASLAYHTAAPEPVDTWAPNDFWRWAGNQLSQFDVPARRVTIARRVTTDLAAWETDPVIGDRIEVQGSTIGATIQSRVASLTDPRRVDYVVDTDQQRLSQKLARERTT